MSARGPRENSSNCVVVAYTATFFLVGVLIVVARFTRVDGAFSGTASPQNSSNSSRSSKRESVAVAHSAATAAKEACAASQSP